MQACHVEVSIYLGGRGVTRSECESALGFVGNHAFTRPGSEEFHSWGRSTEGTTDNVEEIVIQALRALDGLEEAWNQLLDRHPDWRASCLCTLKIPEPAEEQDDYPCILFTPPVLERIVELRMELDVGFTSREIGQPDRWAY